MSNFKCDWKNNASKDFHSQKQVTDIFLIDLNKVVFSSRVQCNNGRLAVHTRHQRKYLVTVYLNMTRTQLIGCHSMFLRSWSECFTMETSGTRLDCSYMRS